MNDTLFSRRVFLSRGVQLLSVASTLPVFLDRAAHVLAADFAANPQGAGRSDRILVIVQFAGGNDGLNTVIPYRDDEYFKARPKIFIPEKDVLKLNDDMGLNPSALGLKKLYDAGNLAIVNAVGYPNHNRSHFRSTDIWASAEPERIVRSGWIGNYFDACCCGQDPEHAQRGAKPVDPSAAVALTNDPPQTILGERFIPMVFRDPQSLTRVESASDDHLRSTFETLNGGDDQAMINDAEHRAPTTVPSHEETSQFLERSALNARVYADRIIKSSNSNLNTLKYPETKLGTDLRLAAQMIASGLPTRVYYVSITGFDTHANQVVAQGKLLQEVGDALLAFSNDLKALDQFNRTTVMTFSEFGRRVKENGTGTDHGEGAPMFMIGGNVKAGFHGDMPSLEPAKLHRGDIAYTTDFRRVYASILKSWLTADDTKILGKKFEQMELFKNV